MPVKNPTWTVDPGEKPARKGYHLEPCRGEAHSNPYIDNCMVCAPRWGWIEVEDGYKLGFNGKEKVEV